MKGSEVYMLGSVSSYRGLLAGIFFSASLGFGASAADIHNGEHHYEECKACHSFDMPVIGPPHCGVVGRKAGTFPGFEYTDAMKNSGLTWDEATLDKFLTNPLEFMPGTAMGFAGIGTKKDRDDVIAYLKQAGSDPKVCAGVGK